MLKPYAPMRSSEVERLGTVPSHWRVVRLSVVSDVINGFPFDSQYFVQEGGTPLIRIRDLHSAQTEVSFSGPIIEEALVRTGEIIIGMDGDFNVARWRGPTALLNQRMCCLRPKPSAHAGFIRYAVAQPLTVIGHLSHSTTVKHLSSKQVKRIQLAVPPMPEQSAIARFLDHADRRIQRYILAKERLIELLQEQKQAIINQAVTGQIDVRTGQPYLAYKDSGVEWLGDVPEHWEVAPLRHVATKFGSGITPRGGANVYEPVGIPFLRSQNVHFDGLRLEGVVRIPPDLHAALRGTHVKPGDVLLNITGASIGRVCAVPDGLGEANVNQHVCIIRPRRAQVLPSFLAAWLRIPGMQEEVALAQIGAAREGLTLDSIRSFKLIIPPVDEQRLIMTELRATCKRLTALADATENQIELFREYRTRLIADVVTGKLDVHEAAARLPDADPVEGVGRGDTVNKESNLQASESIIAQEAGA